MSLPIMNYRVCLQCGVKRLTYSNSLCPRCLLMMKVQAVVEYHKSVVADKAVNQCFGNFPFCKVTKECPHAVKCRKNSRMTAKEKIIIRRALGRTA